MTFGAYIGAEPIQPSSPGVPIPDVVGALARGLIAILGTGLTGVYVGGSLSMGDFVAESSDYDILVVIDDDLTSDDLSGITDLHQGLLRDHKDAWRLEGDYAPHQLLVPEGTLRPVPGVRHGQFEANPTEIMLGADNIANMRLYGIPVCGPPASEVLPLVGPDQVRASVLCMLCEGVDDCTTEAEAASELLNLIRSLCALETGQPTTKSQGAEWALRKLDARWHAIIRMAVEVRRGTTVEASDWTLRKMLPDLDRVARSFHQDGDLTARDRSDR